MNGIESDSDTEVVFEKASKRNAFKKIRVYSPKALI